MFEFAVSSSFAVLSIEGKGGVVKCLKWNLNDDDISGNMRSIS
jgi:hypothetical protein